MTSPADEMLARATAASTAQKLLKAARLLDEAALARIAAIPGAPPVRPAHTRLFPHLDFAGVRVTDLAERLGVTKQAISPLIAELEGWGIVAIEVDPDDRRARRVRFAPDGLRGLLAGIAVLGTFEAEVARRVGYEKMAVFAEVIDVWLDVLDGQGAKPSERPEGTTPPAPSKG